MLITVLTILGAVSLGLALPPPPPPTRPPKPITTSSTTSHTSTSTTKNLSPLWGTCGGGAWYGPTECAAGVCVYYNEWESQCLPESMASLYTFTRPTTTKSVSTLSTTSPVRSTYTATTTAGQVLWGTCGGGAWYGPTTCAEGVCVYYNEWESQCLPASMASSYTQKPPTTTSK